MSRYDIYIDYPRAPGAEPTPGQHDRRGWIELLADLEEARREARAVRDRGGSAYVVPARYRTPLVTQDEARQIAEAARARLLAKGRRIALLSISDDDYLWWTFIADDLDALARDAWPASVRIAVDKLDGTLRTPEQHQEWLRLSFPDGQERRP